MCLLRWDLNVQFCWALLKLEMWICDVKTFECLVLLNLKSILGFFKFVGYGLARRTTGPRALWAGTAR
jgi:hypothetical protein